jgi:hypothetical protein
VSAAPTPAPGAPPAPSPGAPPGAAPAPVPDAPPAPAPGAAPAPVPDAPRPWQRVELALILALLAGTVFLVWPAALAGLWGWAAAGLLPGLLWGALRRTRWPLPPAVGLGLFLLAAGLGVLADLPAGAMLLAGTAALAAWDLDRFLARLRQVSPEQDTRALQNAHLVRLSWVCLLGVGAGFLALNLRLQLSLLPTALLALLLVYALGRVVRS